MRIVIVGGVAGGASAAAKARRVNENADIVMFERGPYVSFANCGLPYYVGGQISKRSALLLQTPESFWKRFRVRVFVRHEVVSIDRTARTVEVKNLSTGELFSQPYDALILAPGAGALVPPLPGVEASNVFTVKTVPDGDAIKSFMEKNAPRRAVVVGGGFIGLESADVLKKAGFEVSVVELLPQLLPPFDPDMARFVTDHVKSGGIDVFLGEGLKALHGHPRVSEVELAGGRRLPTDMVILSLGVRPEIQLAKAAGLAIGPSGGIVVDDEQRTSDPRVFAAGDAVEVLQRVTGSKTRIPLAGPANKQGRVAGANAAGGALRFSGALGTAIVEVMGLAAAKTGLSEREARQAGLPFYASYTHGEHHAGYYPGAEPIHIKLIVEQNTGRLLGAQVIGEKGVDKRIDVLATAVHFKATVHDVEQLDLCYSPQFSSAKDPVLLAGFVAANVAKGEFRSITCEELEQRVSRPNPPQIVDVRTPAEHARGAWPQAVLIPIDELRDRIGELDPAKETVVFCRQGLRGYLAARVLSAHGFKDVCNLSGGTLSCPPPALRETAPPAAKSLIVSVKEFNEELKRGKVRVIDVREPGEFGYERLEGSENIPLSSWSPANHGGDGTVVFVCQTGVRSLEAVHQARHAGLTDVRSLDGGLVAWKKEGFPLIGRKGPIPIMRQVQLVAGAMALIGGAFVSLRWVAVFVGAGLMFAGATGTCAMATLLAELPWNRPRPEDPARDNKPTPRCG